MPWFTITMVGTTERRLIDADNDYEAVAHVADCNPMDVCLPIWRRGATPTQAHLQQYRERCYMPRDNSGRQWIVRDAQDQR